MTRDVYIDNVRREAVDDTARTVTTWDEAGTLTSQRPYTADENAAADAAAINAAKAAVAETLQADTTADLGKLRDSIDALATLLGTDTTTGSIRATLGPTGAVAGTGSLRALAAQTNTNVVAAASIKGLIARCIDLGQRQIDDSQATRKVARQVLRLARQMVGDYSTADVGSYI